MIDQYKKYTRKIIQKLVGGQLIGYLPTNKQRILAGCFNKEKNPDCPHEIQAGKGRDISKHSDWLKEQPDNIFPVFIKEQ